MQQGGNPVAEEGMKLEDANLFPFATGQHFVFSGYELDTLNGRKIAGTERREATHVIGQATVGGKRGWRTVDSTYYPNGSLSHADRAIYAVENGNLLVYLRSSWITVFDKSKGLNTAHQAGQFTELVFGIPITVTVSATIRAAEDVTGPLGIFKAFKLELKYSTTFGGQHFEILNHLYFARNVGPVKIVEPVQHVPFAGMKVNGYESELVGENFWSYSLSQRIA